MNRKAHIVLLLVLAATCRFAPAQEPTAKANDQIVVYLVGQVKQAGRQMLPAGATVLDPFATAGGGDGNENLHKAVIYRKSIDGKQEPIVIKLGAMLKGTIPATVLQNGDVIMIERWKAVF